MLHNIEKVIHRHTFLSNLQTCCMLYNAEMSQYNKTFCHTIGIRHPKIALETVGVDTDRKETVM